MDSVACAPSPRRAAGCRLFGQRRHAYCAAMLGLPVRPDAVIEERGATWFRPVRLRPHSGVLSDFARLMALRRKLISVFVESGHATGNDNWRLLGRQVVMLNHPDSIEHVMVTNRDNYERKSPQMRRALEQLVGDGQRTMGRGGDPSRDRTSRRLAPAKGFGRALAAIVSCRHRGTFYPPVPLLPERSMKTTGRSRAG